MCKKNSVVTTHFILKLQIPILIVVKKIKTLRYRFLAGANYNVKHMYCGSRLINPNDDSWNILYDILAQ